eukprot:TRINITY_DN4168_c0_g6_i5.p1 TRINITY_DN4168_c0_g6~~TRINITY_DN4168_c0_g6_i5.p1  ORF type:complete len:111 (-),score=11.09 TRINITY_DN4168_c0_g6_i5:478-810(-)
MDLVDYHMETSRLKRISDELLKKYPSKIPMLCKTTANSQLPSLKRSAYTLCTRRLLADASLSIGWMLEFIRSQLELNKKNALFLKVGGKAYPLCKSWNTFSIHVESRLCR